MRKPVFIAAHVFFLLMFAAAVPMSIRAADEQLENRLKAAFLLNFAKFTRWPKDVSTTSEFKLCLVGDNPLGGAADELAGKIVNGRPISIEVVKDVSIIRPCNTVFLSRLAKGDTSKLIDAVSGHSRLTVSDREGFAAQGGIIELRIFNNRLGFIINNTRAKQDDISLSASLLNLAHEVL